MKLRRLFPFLLIILILVPLFEIILPTSFVAGAEETMAGSSQSGLIRVALTKNVAPRSDWSNGTLYHLRILQKFIPINITVITNFETLSDYQILFLNMLNISDADITTITNWVNEGGFLVCIGQSGRYDETGEERTSHPFGTVLGVTLDGWQRASGEEVRKVITNCTWYWWSSGIVYDTANNGDGMYHELQDYYYIPKSESVNVTLNEATQIMSCRDKNVTYEEPFLTNNTYGSGKAFFITADAFYRLVWKPPRANVGLYDLGSNVLIAGFWFRSGLLWQILYAIILDCFSDIPLPIVTSMPNGFFTAMGFGMHTSGTGADNDTADDDALENLNQYWRPLMDEYPELKGWFWGFWLATSIIDGTSNASNIVDFVNEFGYAGTRSHTVARTLEDYAISSECLRKNGFKYEYEGSAGGDVAMSTVATLVKDWNFTDIFYSRRVSGGAEHGAFISSIPYPISNYTGVTNFFVSPYAGTPQEWGSLIEKQKKLGQNYGIGGYCMVRNFDSWIGYIPYVNETINTFIDDDTVWKASGQLFVDWWDKRWEINITDFSANSTYITVSLQTPNIQNLTLLIEEMAKTYRNITVDGTPLTLVPEASRLVIPSLSQGTHEIVIKISIFRNAELEEYNDGLRDEGKPYITDSTRTIEYLNFTHPRLSLTLDIPTSVIAKLTICSPYPPRQVFAGGQPTSFTYSANIATILIPYDHVDIYYAQPDINRFSSTKQEYGTDESVALTLEIYGDNPTSEVAKWLARVTVLDEAENIIDTKGQEVEVGRAGAKTLDFAVKNLWEGTYTITAEVLDPEGENVLAMNSLTISVKEASTAPLVFDTIELKKYNDELKVKGLPYIEESTQTIVNLAFSNTYQRLSITLDVRSGVNTSLKICSPYSPRQVFAGGQPTSFTYTANTATILIPYDHVDIYYAQPDSEFTSSKPSYEPDEDVELTLKVHGANSTSEIVKWFIRFTIEDETEKIVKTVYEQIESNATQSFVVGNFLEGTYTITAEIIDPEAENILERRSLTIQVAEAQIIPPLITVIVTTIIVAMIGIAIYAWYHMKKAK